MSAPVVLAAGGTGGHVFPAQALAEALLARGRTTVLFTDDKGRDWRGALGKVTTHQVRSGAIAGRGAIGRALSKFWILVGLWQASALLRKVKPAVVVGFGGYASFPTVLAASRARLPTVIHEQNAVLGRANRWLAPRVAKVGVAFPGVEGVASTKLTQVGMPVRPAIVAIGQKPYEPPHPHGEFVILITGGSQGARIFSEVVPEALARLPAELRRRVTLHQQARPEDLPRVTARYQELGIKADVAAFFEDLPARLEAAHLAICRSGASTVAELAVAGRPAVLVPYPFAADDHQTANARAVDAAGGAWLMPQPQFTATALSERLATLMEGPALLAEAATRARALGRPDAAERLCDLVLSLGDAA